MSDSTPHSELVTAVQEGIDPNDRVSLAALQRLLEQFETLDQWSRDVLPQLSRLIDIIEGRHEAARLIAPHGQTSATPHALLDRWCNLHSNPAKRPSE